MSAVPINKRLPPPTKGRKPHMEGVPGEIVNLEALGIELQFGDKRRESPYDVLLEKLLNAPKGSVLKFPEMRAKYIAVRAKLKGLKVSFAEHGGALYVRIDGRIAASTEAAHTGRRAVILSLLTISPLTAIQLAGKMRAGGDAAVDANLVEAILGQMMRAGEVIHQDGGAWALAPKAKK